MPPRGRPPRGAKGGAIKQKKTWAEIIGNILTRRETWMEDGLTAVEKFIVNEFTARPIRTILFSTSVSIIGWLYALQIYRGCLWYQWGYVLAALELQNLSPRCVDILSEGNPWGDLGEIKWARQQLCLGNEHGMIKDWKIMNTVRISCREKIVESPAHKLRFGSSIYG
jgi:hypothetical protein